MQGNNTALRKNAQELRSQKRATKQEKHLWYDFLKDHSPQFHRQVPIGSYIVDFYCPEVKLVIELDGIQHYEADAMEYDAIRTDYLNSCGCHVVRYLNSDVDRRFRSVCDDIRKQIRWLNEKMPAEPIESK